MAYVSQQLKKELVPSIKSVLKKYKMKGSIAVDNHSTLVVNLKSGAIDFQKDYNGEGVIIIRSTRIGSKIITRVCKVFSD